MTIIEAKQKLSRTIVMSEHNGTTYLDGDSVLNLIDTIYNEFDKQLKQAWIDGSNANYEDKIEAKGLRVTKGGRK
jgi:hypothetical protein